MRSAHQQGALKDFLTLMISAFFIYGYNNVFMIATPLLIADMGDTAGAAGLQNTFFLMAAIALRFFFGPFADRHGRRLVMRVGSGAFLLAAVLLLQAGEVWQVFAIRLVQAVGLAAYFPSASATAAACAGPGHRGMYIGILRVVSSLSLMASPVLALSLIQNHGYPLFLQCMAAFAALGMVGILFISPQADSLNDPDQFKAAGSQKGEENKDEKDKDTKGRLKRQALVGRYGVDTLPLLRKCPFIVGTTFASAFSYGVLMSFASPYLNGMAGVLNAGFFFTIFSLGGIVANGTCGWLSDRFGRLKLTVCTLFSLGSGLILFALLPQNPYFFYPAGLLGGAGYYGSIAVLMAWMTEQAGSHERTAALALQQNGLDLGIAAGSGTFGVLLAWGWNEGLLYKALGGAYLGYALLSVFKGRPGKSNNL